MNSPNFVAIDYFIDIQDGITALQVIFQNMPGEFCSLRK